MRMIHSMSARFARSRNYTMPEYRSSRPRPRKRGISLAAPLGQPDPGTGRRGGRSGRTA